MLALTVFLLLVAAVAFAAWLTRGRELPVRCCQPGSWPPDDLHSPATKRTPVSAIAERSH